MKDELLYVCRSMIEAVHLDDLIKEWKTRVEMDPNTQEHLEEVNLKKNGDEIEDAKCGSEYEKYDDTREESGEEEECMLVVPEEEYEDYLPRTEQNRMKLVWDHMGLDTKKKLLKVANVMTKAFFGDL